MVTVEMFEERYYIKWDNTIVGETSNWSEAINICNEWKERVWKSVIGINQYN